ncbi:MAG: ABC transporter ATP-binding protein [Candidatus Thermoplasmatota archaeon]|nr:ABC transporter ATP-binding protein [Candidatus Thermoplasmatota archaeon]
MIETDSVTKIYKTGKIEFRALNNVSLKVKEGDFIALMGPSGSGKTTLMNLIGCLDRATSGEIILDGKNLSVLNDNQLAEIRSKKIGFIFQTFNLIPTISALKNVELPLVFGGVSRNSREKIALDLLRKFGLEKWAGNLPSELSGGQQQRVAIARALANNPSILLADEPTGNLDSATGLQIMNYLASINKEGKTIILVTHDKSLKKYANRVITMRDGEISEHR